MFQVGTGKPVLGYFSNAAVFHICSEDALQGGSNLGFAFTAVAFNDHHPLALVAGNQAVANKLLECRNVLRVQQIIQKPEPTDRLRGIWVVGDGQPVTNNLRPPLCEPAVQKQCPIGKMNAVCLRRKIPHLCLQLQHFQNVIDLPWNVVHGTAFQLFVDFAPEGQIIRQPTIRREKGSVGKENLMLPQKLLAEQSFIDAGPVKPCGPFPIRQFFLPGNGRCPPCFFSPHNHVAHKLCRLSEKLVAPVPAVPNHRQLENPERN